MIGHRETADDNMEVDERTEIDPAEYFNPDRPARDPGPIRKHWYPVVVGLGGVLFACFANSLSRRPAFSGIQKHILGGTLGVVIGITADNYGKRKAAHRDLMLYNYIVNHPEDFPPIERKKFADVFEKWVPVR
ncbi:NADH dehydrogenase [ubiquinone] 1 subunit C2 [Macrobrachium rosenbergii]|uniref:NADH dehydrogenase [ubiquinone] 1 subunit C2 n=1 Tax=Macrobrachium rosenbergii TaxID=79674 RepID=UPI0034D4C12D